MASVDAGFASQYLWKTDATGFESGASLPLSALLGWPAKEKEPTPFHICEIDPEMNNPPK